MIKFLAYFAFILSLLYKGFVKAVLPALPVIYMGYVNYRSVGNVWMSPVEFFSAVLLSTIIMIAITLGKLAVSIEEVCVYIKGLTILAANEITETKNDTKNA